MPETYDFFFQGHKEEKENTGGRNGIHQWRTARL